MMMDPMLPAAGLYSFTLTWYSTGACRSWRLRDGRVLMVTPLKVTVRWDEVTPERATLSVTWYNSTSGIMFSLFNRPVKRPVRTPSNLLNVSALRKGAALQSCCRPAASRLEVVLAKFSPNSSLSAAPVQILCRKDVTALWTELLSSSGARVMSLSTLLRTAVSEFAKDMVERAAKMSVSRCFCLASTCSALTSEPSGALNNAPATASTAAKVVSASPSLNDAAAASTALLSAAICSSGDRLDLARVDTLSVRLATPAPILVSYAFTTAFFAVLGNMELTRYSTARPDTGLNLLLSSKYPKRYSSGVSRSSHASVFMRKSVTSSIPPLGLTDMTPLDGGRLTTTSWTAVPFRPVSTEVATSVKRYRPRSNVLRSMRRVGPRQPVLATASEQTSKGQSNPGGLETASLHSGASRHSLSPATEDTDHAYVTSMSEVALKIR
mmetsp:Transcript_15639/g.53388  ORF Transcript_15639/g.53388 Transcript_15639/m.53388 type:complete len:439 (+) Transcript_15639:403-1719(+)